MEIVKAMLTIKTEVAFDAADLGEAALEEWIVEELHEILEKKVGLLLGSLELSWDYPKGAIESP